MERSLEEKPEERLIEAAVSGDEDSFTELVRRYKRMVLATASRFARDGQELDDLCQDIFIKVYEKLGSFRGDAPFEHWLRRITVHASYDLLRKRRREPLVPLEDAESIIEGTPAGDTQAAIEARNVLAWAMSGLKPEERLAITLLELEENTIKEVATLTGWSEAKVKVRGFRARQALKKILGLDDEKR